MSYIIDFIFMYEARGPRKKNLLEGLNNIFFQMLSIMGSLPTMVKDMTGVDIKQKITASG